MVEGGSEKRGREGRGRWGREGRVGEGEKCGGGEGGGGEGGRGERREWEGVQVDPTILHNFANQSIERIHFHIYIYQLVKWVWR